jgi:hypothetical protein
MPVWHFNLCKKEKEKIMTIDIRDANHNKVGYITDNGGDISIRDANHNKVGYITDIAIIATHGKCKVIRDANANIVGHIEGNAPRVQMAAAAFLLLNLRGGSGGSSSGGGGSSDENSGCLGKIIGAIIGAIGIIIAHYLQTWPGRIGVAYGLAFGILSTIAERANIGMGIFLSIMFILICGALGLLGGFVSSKLSRHGNFGALIGAAVAGIVMIVTGAIGKTTLPVTLVVSLLAAVPGLAAGAIIGAIVGLVKKQIDKKK